MKGQPEQGLRERPILFNGPMVRAILEGRKTQTRRVVKLRRGASTSGAFWDHPGYEPAELRSGKWAFRDKKERGEAKAALGSPDWDCPYGEAGDRLWVRETWQSFGDSSTIRPRVPHACQVRYDATGTTAWCRVPEGARGVYPAMFRSRPSIHMPRWASRITLEVVAVRMERLQDISAADALAEGAPEWAEDTVQGDRYPARAPGLERHWYMQLWESINGVGSWDANPWVWVVEFKRVEGGAA